MKAILYFSHNKLPLELELFFQKHLHSVANGIPIIAVMQNIRSPDSTEHLFYKTIKSDLTVSNWKSIRHQMNLGLEFIINEFGSDCSVFFGEHDVLYDPSYFSYVPDCPLTFLRNINLYFLTYRGFLGPHNTLINSQLVAHASLINKCLKTELPPVNLFKTPTFYNIKKFKSTIPSIDVRHGYNYTGPRGVGRSLDHFIQNLPTWGNFLELWDSIPETKLHRLELLNNK